MVPSHVVGLDAGRKLTETTRDSVLTENLRETQNIKSEKRERKTNVGPAPNLIVSQLFTQ